MSKFSVAITRDSLTTQISNPDFMGIADEPVEIGGQNKGPTPYDLLLSALACCTAITLKMYCNRKGWEVTRIRVRVDFSRDYEKDCEGSGVGKEKIDVFDRKISIEGSLEEAQRERLLEIADKCPVHKTLENNAKIISSIEPASR